MDERERERERKGLRRLLYLLTQKKSCWGSKARSLQEV
jgi:hypothetical protein